MLVLSGILVVIGALSPVNPLPVTLAGFVTGLAAGSRQSPVNGRSAGLKASTGGLAAQIGSLQLSF